MMAKNTAPRVVAHLGRPETPEETAARKAVDSRNHRQRQTVSNLIYALIATLGLMIFIVLIVPRSDTPIEPIVDVAAVAQGASVSTGRDLVVPSVPQGWRSNAAELRTTADDIQAWYVGYLTADDEYIGLYQGFETNPTWVAERLNKTLAVGTVDIAGVDWTVYDNRKSSADVGNARYGLVTEVGDETFILLGSAEPIEFTELATAIAPSITERQGASS